MRRALLALLLAVQASAQVQEHITVERIIVDARVTEDRGNPITGLKASDFRVRIDGKPAAVESSEWIPETAAARELASIDAAIADVNTSLDQPAPRGRLLIFFYQTDFARNSARAAGQMQTVVSANDWLDWLDPEDRVAVFSFDSHLKFRLDFTNNKDHIKDAMQQAMLTNEPPWPRMVPMPALAKRLDPKELRDAASSEAALIIVANALRPIPGPKSIILFGWGLGRLTPTGVMMEANYVPARQALESARASVFSIDFTQADSHSLEVGLGKVAGDTGGFYAKTFHFPKIAVDRLQKTLAGHYELEVRKPDTKVRGTHTIEVDVPSQRRATVLARSTYVDRD
ncbi:MAG TPA: VWA domain-containing protein [Thermoanaerobaculia bacterium]|jgi:VWFA-related protein|nr:VWA domain-containing protein [Thermoanaerobaculia bacterium]